MGQPVLQIVTSHSSTHSTESVGFMTMLVSLAPVATSVGLLLVGIAGASIAWRQSRMARTKLQLDLYERRLPVWEGTMTFLASVLTKGRVSQEAFSAFGLARREVIFLFSHDLAVYLKSISDRAAAIMAYEEMLKGAGTPEERAVWASKLQDARLWLVNQYDVAIERFSPFMQLEQRGSTVAWGAEFVSAVLISTLEHVYPAELSWIGPAARALRRGFIRRNKQPDPG